MVLLPYTECPVSDEDDYRIEVLISLRRLERLDKDEYTDDERQEAEEVSCKLIYPIKCSALEFMRKHKRLKFSRSVK